MMPTVSDVLSAIDLFKTTKAITDVLDDFEKRKNEIITHEEILSLRKKVLALQKEALQIEEALSKEQKITANLLKVLSEKDDLEFLSDGGIYSSKESKQKYCTKCWHESLKKVPLCTSDYDDENWNCAVCKSYFHTRASNERAKKRYERNYKL